MVCQEIAIRITSEQFDVYLKLHQAQSAAILWRPGLLKKFLQRAGNVVEFGFCVES